MSTQTMASRRAYQLEAAITRMAMRYGQAERLRAKATEDYITCRGDEAKARAAMARWERASDRRFNALLRLTAALRDLPFKS